jgi:nickel transport system ATP-binding protein
MASGELLTVENLTLTLETGAGKRPLVKDLSFTLGENRILGLIGESGSGKSLTCLAIMGLLPGIIRKTGGEIRFRGRSVGDLPEPRLRAMRGRTLGMILQNPMSCFDAVFTIRQHFKETLLSHEKKPEGPLEKRMTDALASVGFDEPAAILDLYPFQMSGGMLQRVMVALALLMKSPLLIADEPTTDLDVVSQTRILDLLEKIRTEHNMAILLVTHDLGVIARLSDEVAVMQKGEIVDRGSVDAMFRAGEGRHPYTGALMEAHFSLYDSRLQRFGVDSAPGW